MEWIRENRILWRKIGIIAGVYLGMKYLVPLVIPFLVAALVVCWCWPFLRWAKKRLHLKPPFVMAVLLVLFLGLLGTGFYVAGRELGGFAYRLCSREAAQVQMEEFLYDCCDSVGELFHMEASGLRVFVADQLNVFMDQARQNILPGAMGGSWQILKGLGSWVAGMLVAGVSVLLLAADFEKAKELGRQWPVYGKAVQIIRRILHSVGSYLRAQAIIMGVVMLLCTIGIWISGSSSNPVLAGVGTGILDALPVFGTGTVFLPWILIRVVQKEYVSALILAATYGVCALAREILEPKLVGRRLGVLPIVILMSVYVGIRLYGLGGILLGPLSVLLVQELWKQES